MRKHWDWSGWTEDWLPLLDAYKTAPDLPGVYIIAADRAIHRLVGVDEHGILDIGESDSLQARLSAFVGCARGTRQAGHSAGWRFLDNKFAEHFPLESLWVSWRTAHNKEEAHAGESQYLSTYLSLHYELPPLNHQFNWSA